MPLKFYCEKCGQLIATKFLKCNEQTKCYHCYNLVSIPENAVEIDDNEYLSLRKQTRGKTVNQFKENENLPNSDHSPTANKKEMITENMTSQSHKSSPMNPGFIIKFFSFSFMITKPLIQILIYPYGAICITIRAFQLLSGEEESGPFASIFLLFGSKPEDIGFSLLIFGNLLWRIICEFLIVVFRIHNYLLKIQQKLTD